MERRWGRVPAEFTTFVGRTAELASARGLLKSARLVTITGVSGVGKSRLAARVTREHGGDFTDGVCYVDLSRVTEVDLLASAVAAALGLAEPEEPLDAVADYLAERHLLLVLDTCEHIIDGCALLTEVLLREAPRLWILATSREPLRIIGEHLLPISPLSTPEPDEPLTAGPGRFDAVSLFADRAAAVQPGFLVEERNWRSVTRLCHQLEGIPLAIELAAARLPVLTVDQIVQGLDDRFTTLGSARTGLDRHQTLRSAVDWSHALCTSQEQRVWAELSVFTADFEAPAAAHVCELPGIEEVLSRLVQKSLLIWRPDSRRYRMLDTIREFGAQRLGDRAPALRARHRDWYLELARECDRKALTADQFGTVPRLLADHPNVRRALEFSLATPGQEHLALETAARLWLFWITCGLSGEGRLWLDRALPLVTGRDEARARALWTAGQFALMQGGDLAGAEDYIRRLRGLAEEMDSALFRARADQLAGLSALFSDDLTGAVALLERALPELLRPPGPVEAYFIGVPQLAAALCILGELDRAEEVCVTARQVSERCGDHWFASYPIWVRGIIWWLRGDLPKAVAAGRESLRYRRGLDDRIGAALSLDSLAWYAMALDDPERAARLLGATAPMWELLGRPHFGSGSFAALRTGTEDQARAALGDRRYEAARARGAGMTPAQLVEYALADGPAPHDNPLSQRELEIARLAASGLSNREIAERLFIAKRTVDTHIEHILAKLAVGSRTQIVFRLPPEP